MSTSWQGAVSGEQGAGPAAPPLWWGGMGPLPAPRSLLPVIVPG